MLNITKWKWTTWLALGLIQIVSLGIFIFVSNLLTPVPAPTPDPTTTPTRQPTSTPYPYQDYDFRQEADDICGRTYDWFTGSGKFSPSTSYNWDTKSVEFTYYPNGDLEIDGVVYEYNYNIHENLVERADRVAMTPRESALVFKTLKEMTIVPLRVSFLVQNIQGTYGYYIPKCLPLAQ